MAKELIFGMVLFLVGLFFFFNNKNIGKGCASFYKRFYTKKNLTIMFKIMGFLLIVVSLILFFV